MPLYERGIDNPRYGPKGYWSTYFRIAPHLRESGKGDSGRLNKSSLLYKYFTLTW